MTRLTDIAPRGRRPLLPRLCLDCLRRWVETLGWLGAPCPFCGAAAPEWLCELAADLAPILELVA